MDPVLDTASQRCHLPGMRSVSSASSSVDLTEDRRLPPLPRIEPLQRDLFNPYTQRNFMPSPPNTHEAFPVKSPWPSAEHIVPPLSPANSSDSWGTDTKPLQRSLIWPQDPTKMSADELIDLVAPDARLITRKQPLQQPCGRKRKATTMLADSDDQREKHRVAEGTRRANLSALHLELDQKLHDFWLRVAGWKSEKSQAESKEHIVRASIHLIEFMRFIIVWLLCDVKKREVPQYLQEEMNAKLRCMEFERQVHYLLQEEQKTQREFATLKRDYQALEERNRALEYQLSAREHMFRSPQSDHLSPQQLAALPDSTKRGPLPGLRVLRDEPVISTSDSVRLNVTPVGASRSFNHSFISHTPSTTGPSSPVSHQGTYPVTISRPPSFTHSP